MVSGWGCLAAPLFLAMPVYAGDGGAAADIPAGVPQGQVIVGKHARFSSVVSGGHFTGRVRVKPLFASVAPARAYGASVTFDAGARTDWHVHPLGQTLVVTSGTGLTQEWGGPVRRIGEGDVVICPPGVRHWHGAAPDTAMTHLAIGERQEGQGVVWMEKVSDEQYFGQ